MSNEEKNTELLIDRVGEETALRLVKLQTNLDKYLFRFKKEVNELLMPYGYEVLCGVAYKEKQD